MSIYTGNRELCTDISTPHARLMASVYWVNRPQVMASRAERALADLENRIAATIRRANV